MGLNRFTHSSNIFSFLLSVASSHSYISSIVLPELGQFTPFEEHLSMHGDNTLLHIFHWFNSDDRHSDSGPDTGEGRLYYKAVPIPTLMSAGSTGLHSNAIFFHGVWLLLQP